MCLSWATSEEIGTWHRSRNSYIAFRRKTTHLLLRMITSYGDVMCTGIDARYASVVFLVGRMDSEKRSRIDYPPVEGEGDDLPGDEFAGFLQRLLRGHLKTAAAGNLHAHDGYE